MFGHFAHFSPKKYSVQKKNLVIPSMNSEGQNPEIKDQLKGFKIIYKSSR